jgi:hypothetical protein
MNSTHRTFGENCRTHCDRAGSLRESVKQTCAARSNRLQALERFEL